MTAALHRHTLAARTRAPFPGPSGATSPSLSGGAVARRLVENFFIICGEAGGLAQKKPPKKRRRYAPPHRLPGTKCIVSTLDHRVWAESEPIQRRSGGGKGARAKKLAQKPRSTRAAHRPIHRHTDPPHLARMFDRRVHPPKKIARPVSPSSNAAANVVLRALAVGAGSTARRDTASWI